MSLNETELVVLAVHAGLPMDKAKIAAAIAIAESGGDPNAHNSKPPDDSYGLWQINMIGPLGPARRLEFGLKANTDLFNTETNAKAMSEISKQGKDFTPWSTYTSGAYKSHAIPDLVPAGGGVSNPISSTAGAIASATEALGKATLWVSNVKNWERVGFVVVGSIVFVAGLVMVLSSTRAGQTATTVAKTAVKVAAA
jgi:hypothetical protein